MTLAPDIDIYGVKEAAAYLGITRTHFTVRLTRSRQGIERHPLPVPCWQLACGPIWTREQLDEWRESGRS